MGNKIAALVVIALLCFGGYYVYQHHRQEQQLESGEVQCVGCDTPEQHARFLKENSGETADGQNEHKRETAQQSAVTAASADTSTNTPNNAPDGRGSFAVSDSNAPQPMNPPASAGPMMNGTAAGSMPPAMDSQAANNPNGARFGGSGSFQWYRQGNLTYRVDTASGHSCIAYATLEEWRKQIVLSNGCGRNS